MRKYRNSLVIRFPDSEDEPDVLTELVTEVVDRFLIYTNREPLVSDYEDDLLVYADGDDFWTDYNYPSPTSFV